MRSAGRSSPSRKNPPGPRWESTWPTMTDEPIAPGRGLPVYQPATAVVDGTWSAPPAVTPSSTSRVRTPMAGMIRLTGRATGRAAADGAGSALTGPTGAWTTGAWTTGAWCRPSEAPPAPWVITRPTRPVAMASTPNATITGGVVASQDHAFAARRARPGEPSRRRRKPARSARARTSADARGSPAGPADLAGPDDSAQRRRQAGHRPHQPPQRPAGPPWP